MNQRKFSLGGQIADRFECEKIRTGRDVSSIVSEALDHYLRQLEEFRALGITPPGEEPKPEEKPPEKKPPRIRKKPVMSAKRLAAEAVRERNRTIPPEMEWIEEECLKRGAPAETAKDFLAYWNGEGWIDKKGKRVDNWVTRLGTYLRLRKDWAKKNSAPELTQRTPGASEL